MSGISLVSEIQRNLSSSFYQLSLDARQMTYWRGEKLTNKEAALAIDKGPPQKLSLTLHPLITLVDLPLNLHFTSVHVGLVRP